jgi:hypothetical protein
MSAASDAFYPFMEQPRAAQKRETFEALEAQITELWGHLNAATYRFLELVAEFDRRQAYVRHGLANTAQWLNWQCGIRSVAAREKVRVARALEQLPEISASFALGEISYSKVRAMTRVATPANESVLVHVARHGTASHVEKLVRKYRWTERRDAAKLAHAYVNRQVHCFNDANDTFILHARLPPEIGAVVRKALEVAGDVLRERAGETRDRIPPPPPSAVGWALDAPEHSHAARRADALRHIVETFLAALAEESEGHSSADRYQVVVHVDQAVLARATAPSSLEPHDCEIDDGPSLALDTARRLACDATLVGVVNAADGEPLDIGRKTRSIPPPLKRALKARDRGCRFPGCDRTRFTHGHHVEHWADGGHTKLANLVTLCSFHHLLVHEGGYGVRTTDDGLFVFSAPDGRRIPESGAPFPVIPRRVMESFSGNNCSRAPESASEGTGAACFRGNISSLGRVRAQPPDGDAGLRAILQRLAPKLHIDAQTSRCRWLGEPMDYNHAVEAMQFLRDRAESRGREPSG